jgi:hypothetical protein
MVNQTILVLRTLSKSFIGYTSIKRKATGNVSPTDINKDNKILFQTLDFIIR